VCNQFLFNFFFSSRRRHTRSKRDWSSDVCSSDLAAATAMAAGVEEGEELTRYIQILDGTVAGSSGTFEEMEQIFGRIVDQGHMTRNEFDMIAQRMPGFSKAVQDNMNVSSEE